MSEVAATRYAGLVAVARDCGDEELPLGRLRRSCHLLADVAGEHRAELLALAHGPAGTPPERAVAVAALVLVCLAGVELPRARRAETAMVALLSTVLDRGDAVAQYSALSGAQRWSAGARAVLAEALLEGASDDTPASRLASACRHYLDVAREHTRQAGIEALAGEVDRYSGQAIRLVALTVGIDWAPPEASEEPAP